MNNFAVLDIAHFFCVSQLTITIHTNYPCHLTCYHTDQKPLRHTTSRRERGIDLPWGAYFCFVAWTPVVQVEAGDTLTHSFNIYPWELLQTKWFAFRGTIGGVLSPSVSPIFWFKPLYHNLFQNGLFDNWPAPAYPPPYWERESAGPGSSKITREEIIVDTPPYSARLEGVGWLQRTRLVQLFCAVNLADKLVTCRIRFKRVGQGYYNIGLRINATSGVNRWTTGNPSSAWRTYVWSGYISSDVTWGRVTLGHLSRNATIWGGFVFDSVTFTWPP